jgi:hypothetical protein
MIPSIKEDLFQVQIRPVSICSCSIEIYRLKDFDVVVCSERLDNKGMSVTNAAEQIATKVVLVRQMRGVQGHAV